MEVQTLNGRTLIFELLSSVHQHGRFLVASAQFSAFKIFREYIYIYIRSLKFTAYSSAVVIIHPDTIERRSSMSERTI